MINHTLAIHNYIVNRCENLFSENILNNLFYGITLGQIINDKKFQSRSLHNIYLLSKNLLLEIKEINGKEILSLSEEIEDKKMGLYKSIVTIESFLKIALSSFQEYTKTQLETELSLFFDQNRSKIIKIMMKKKLLKDNQQQDLNRFLTSNRPINFDNYLYYILKEEYLNLIKKKINNYKNISFRLLRILTNDFKYSQIKYLQSYDSSRKFEYFIDI